MNKKKYQIWEKIPVNTLILVGVCLFFMIASLFEADKTRSARERRSLQTFPDLTIQTVVEGQFQQKLDTYNTDQIAFRDSLLEMSAWIDKTILLNLDVHGIVSKNGHLIAIFDEMDSGSIAYAANLFSSIYERYLENTDCSIYFSIIPDKAYYLEDPLVPVIDYEEFFNLVLQKVDFAQYIDLTSSLNLEDYYYTDSHWKIENLEKTADTLAGSMGIDIDFDLSFEKYSNSFLGVYASQSFGASNTDELLIPDKKALSSLKLYEYSTGQKKEIPLIAQGSPEDMYQVYLSGNNGLLELVNEDVQNGRELVLFRDSYASSLSFYLTQGYERIWLIDLRDFNSSLISRFIDFTNQDILFLYSTTILNNGYTLR